MNDIPDLGGSFGQRNLGRCDLGDARRTRRLVRAADDILAHPAEPLRPRAEAVSVWRDGEARGLTVREFTLALARLGGHLGRKCDGMPGWLTLWRGWERLNTMLDYESSRRSCGKQ